MRKRGLVALAVVLIGVIAIAWWRHREAASHDATAKTSQASRTEGRATRGERASDEPSPVVLVDDDPRGTLRLEGQVVDADEHPVGGATVVLSSNPPRSAATQADG